MITFRKNSVTGFVVPPSPFQPRFYDMLMLPAKFWILSVICMVYYSAVFPFVSLGQVFLVKKYDYSLGQANFVISEFSHTICFSGYF